VARLKPGVSAAAATSEVSALQYQIHLANASKPVAEDVWFRPMIDDLAKNVRTPLLVLLGAVGCMLLIACLNLTNLLVARSATRRREVAVRVRLRQPCCSYLRADDGKLADLSGRWSTGPAAVAGFDLLALGALAQSTPRRVRACRWMVLTFTLALVAAAALLAGLVPAISSTGKGLLSGLRDPSRTMGGSALPARLRKTMLTVEIALTVVLLISAGLISRASCIYAQPISGAASTT